MGMGRLVALVLGIWLAVAAPALASAPDDFFAVNVGGLFPDGKRTPTTASQLQAIAAAGIHAGRSDATWIWIEPFEPRQGVPAWRWNRTDTVVSDLARHGIRWRPVLAYSATWDRADLRFDHSPPRSAADYAAYTAQVARRYGTGGDFWRAHPALPPMPVKTYEVWNEENHPDLWSPTPDPAAYAELFAAAREAIKGADPYGRVIVGGLVPGGAGDFVAAMLAARPDLRSTLDGVGLHPYADDVAGALEWVRQLRAALDAQGESATPIDVTESGWPTQGEDTLGAAPLPDATRAADLSLLADVLAPSNCRVSAFAPYAWVTPESDPRVPDDWLGLYHPDGTATDAGAAFTADTLRFADGERSHGTLRVCGPPARSSAHAPRLGLAVDRHRGTSRTCLHATVTYRGRPVNGVTVAFTLSGDALESGHSGADGKATWCAPDGARGEASVRATIPRAAASTAWAGRLDG
jgi:hypothetical protein